MSATNSVNIIGKVCSLPQKFVTNANQTVVIFGVATKRLRHGKRYVDRHRIMADGPRAEACMKLTTKSKVSVYGELQYAAFKDAAGGERQEAMVVAKEIMFMHIRPGITATDAPAVQLQKEWAEAADSLEFYRLMADEAKKSEYMKADANTPRKAVDVTQKSTLRR